MIVALEAVGDRVSRCAPALLPRQLQVVRDWKEYERLAPAAACSVVVLEWLDGDEGPAVLRRFQRRFPSHPVVLATRGCMENARHLRHLMVEEVVWLVDLETALPAAVRRILASGPQNTLAGVISEARHLPRTLREALAHACLAPRPVYSVAELASSVHCDRTTLCLQWRKAVGPAARLRLVDFLGLILLVHAARRRQLGRKWQDVAGELGVHEQTLRRLATRLVGPESRQSAEADELRAVTTLDTFVRGYLAAGRAAGDDGPAGG